MSLCGSTIHMHITCTYAVCCTCIIHVISEGLTCIYNLLQHKHILCVCVFLYYYTGGSSEDSQAQTSGEDEGQYSRYSGAQ